MSVIVRFIEKILVDCKSSCIEWSGGKTSRGYSEKLSHLSDKYGVSILSVYNAVKGITWKCVQ